MCYRPAVTAFVLVWMLWCRSAPRMRAGNWPLFVRPAVRNAPTAGRGAAGVAQGTPRSQFAGRDAGPRRRHVGRDHARVQRGSGVPGARVGDDLRRAAAINLRLLRPRPREGAWSAWRLAGRRKAGSTRRIVARPAHRRPQKAELWGMDQWRLFARLVKERNPKSIAVNISADHNFADGLTVGEWEQMKEALGPELEKSRRAQPAARHRLSGAPRAEHGAGLPPACRPSCTR